MARTIVHTLIALFVVVAPATAGLDSPSWRFSKPSSTGIPGDCVETIYIDEQDRPWIPAYIPVWEEGGMARMEAGRWTTISNVNHPIIASPRFNDIVADADGIMWIATDYGLLWYDPDIGPDSFVRYDQDNTPMPASEIFGLDIDPDGAIWMSTFASWFPYFGGVTVFDGKTWTTFTEENSPLPLEQVWDLETRAVLGGYEVRVGTAGEAIAVLAIDTAGRGDVDGDGTVGILDFLELLAAWGPCGDCGGCPADFDGDCQVGVGDFLVLLASWG